MKFFIVAFFAVGTFAAENYSGPEYAPIDASSIVPIENLPGFWDGRNISLPSFEKNNVNPRVIGGQEVVPNSIPWQVALHISFLLGTALCSGSVLSTNTVLTAAHCIAGSSSSIAIAGAHNRNIIEATQQRRLVTSANYRINENYNPFNFNNNIAIMIVPSNWTLTAAVQLTNLPVNFNNELFVGQTSTISGWGYTSILGPTSDVLRSVQVPIISNDNCSSLLGTNLPSSVICTTTNLLNQAGACLGDSGSSVTIPNFGNVQIAVVSANSMLSCDGSLPIVMTRLTSFNDWIITYLNVIS